jgi:hypothetical protein
LISSVGCGSNVADFASHDGLAGEYFIVTDVYRLVNAIDNLSSLSIL